MIKRLLIVLVLLALVFGGIFGWKYYTMKQMAAQASQPQPPATVASATVKQEQWQPTLYAIGNLTAIQGVDVANEVAGVVESVNFESGESVKKGDVLVKLDDRMDQAELQGLVAQRRLAEVQFERFKKLLAQKSTSKSQYDEAQAKLESARAQVDAKRAYIDKKAIKAPFSGRVGIRQVDVGQYLASGTSVVTLQALDRLYVDFTLPERDIAKVEPGQKVEVNLQAYGDRRFEGKISAISPKVESGTRSLQLRAVIPNQDHLLRPGMFANVHVQLPTRNKVLTVPRTAITYNPYGDSVFVIMEKNGNKVVQRRQVEIGDSQEGQVEVTKGLEAGDQVVRAGQVKLRNGQSVTIDNSVKLSPDASGGEGQG